VSNLPERGTRPRLFGTLVVQDEGDIIEELLGSLAELDAFDAIFFFDLGSEDDTFERAMPFDGLLHAPQRIDAIYTNRLRSELIFRNRRHYRVGDWLALIDADEFYENDPRDLIRLAVDEDADSVLTYQAEFWFTDSDLQNLPNEDVTRPIRERRHHYLIDWSEARFFRYGSESQSGLSAVSPCSQRLLNRHYQYRTPSQIERRIRTRRKNQQRSIGMEGRSEWLHVQSDDWRDYLVPHRLCQYDDGGELRFGLPDGVLLGEYMADDPEIHRMAQLALEIAAHREGAPR